MMTSNAPKRIDFGQIVRLGDTSGLPSTLRWHKLVCRQFGESIHCDLAQTQTHEASL